MNISLAPETIFHLFGTPITNAITGSWLVIALIFVMAIAIRASLKAIPGRAQALFELIYDGFFNLANGIIEREEVTREIFPYIIALFIFIVIGSWLGLLPGASSIGFKAWHDGQLAVTPLFRAPTTDLNMTLVLAVFSVGYVQYLGIKYAGLGPYLKKFFNFHNPIGFFVGALELVSEFTRIISYSFRLFGNIFAGEVLIGVTLYLTVTLIPYFPPTPILFVALEIAVALIQAFVFCFLTIIFTSLAIIGHDAHEREHGGEELVVAERAAEAEDEFEGVTHRYPQIQVKEPA